MYERPKVNMSAAMMQDMPPNFETAVRIAARNADAEVDAVMDKYEDGLKTKLSEFIAKDFTVELKPIIEAAMKEYEADIKNLAATSKEISKLMKELAEAAKSRGDAAGKLTTIAGELSAEAEALDKKIAEVAAKAGKLGGQLGALLGTGIKSMGKSFLPFL